MGERSQHVLRVVYETLKQWKLLNSLLQFKIIMIRRQYLERCMVMELRRFDFMGCFKNIDGEVGNTTLLKRIRVSLNFSVFIPTC